MIAPAALRTLREALGPECVREDEGASVDGERLAPTLAPADAEALAAALRTLAELSLACVIRGGGSRLELGNPPRGAALLLSTAALAGVDDFDPSEGVCHARAGTPLAAIEACVAPAGWELPLDPPGAGATLGGVLAAAALGPRANGFGRTRDHVLGLEVVLADGARTHCGGRVVKNVTGYDLNKLYVGSLGTLGVIEGAWLRLRPRPERTRLLETSPGDPAAAYPAALAAARRPTARAVALLAGPEPRANGAARLVIELAGDAASVERDASALAAELATQPAPADALERVRARQGATPQPNGLRARLAALPSRAAAALARLPHADVVAYPGLGLVHAGYALPAAEDPAALADVLREVAGAAAASGAACLLEAAPAWAKRGRDVFGELGGSGPIVRELKRRFDPAGRLNPGRFAGGA